MLVDVLYRPDCDIDCTFLGFIDTYYYLAKIIPLHWTVVDFGCAYNAQAYYFRKHKKFIGVDPCVKVRFSFENTELFTGTIAQYLKSNPPVEQVFAICNNVPSRQTEMIREYYPNCFIYYTAGNIIKSH
jgi:hypothetical protein